MDNPQLANAGNGLSRSIEVLGIIYMTKVSRHVNASDRQAGAHATLVAGVAKLLAAWETSDDLYDEGATKIVDWVLAQECLHEAVS